MTFEEHCATGWTAQRVRAGTPFATTLTPLAALPIVWPGPPETPWRAMLKTAPGRGVRVVAKNPGTHFRPLGAGLAGRPGTDALRAAETPWRGSICVAQLL